MAQLWGGRFTKQTDQLVFDFNASITFDKRLFHEDVTGSIVHATMLAKQGILTEEEKKSIIEGLTGILEDVDAGKLTIDETQEDIHSFVEATLAEGVDLIPANIELAGLEVSLVNCMNREKMLKQVLDGARHEYDFILLDCTPSLGMLTVNALAAADTTLIPVQAQYLSAKGLEQLLQTVQKVRRQINPKLKIEGILLTMTDSRTNYGQQIDNLIRGAYGSKIKVFDQTIPRSVRAAEISAVGKSIFQHDPKGKVAEAYKSLTREVMANAEKQLKHVAERGR